MLQAGLKLFEKNNMYTYIETLETCSIIELQANIKKLKKHNLFFVIFCNNSNKNKNFS